MKTLLSMLLISSSAVCMAAPTLYQEQNFSIEFPAGWQKAETPPKALALFRSADNKKGIVVMVVAVSAADRSTALGKLVSGAKKAATAKGIPITGEKALPINGTTFHSYSFTLPGNVATLSNMAVAGNWGYSIQGFSGVSDPATDPEIKGAIHSFRLISPVASETPVIPEAAKPESSQEKPPSPPSPPAH